MPLGKASSKGKLFSPPTKAKHKAKEESSASSSKSDAARQQDSVPQGTKSKLPKRSGSLKFSFRKKIKDVVKDLENKSAHVEVGEVLQIIFCPVACLNFYLYVRFHSA